jgi:uroporphyrinogen-III synthase
MGVDLFFYDPRWHAKRVLTVGEATGQLAAKFGYPDVICTGETVDDLRRYLNTNPFTKAFYPSATDVTAPLEKEFPEKVERVPIYQMVARDGLPPQFIDQALRLRIVVPFFSRRNAEIFADLAAKAGLTKNNTAILAVGMGADTFVDLDGPWQSSVTAAKPTMNYMVATTDMAISRMSM